MSGQTHGQTHGSGSGSGPVLVKPRTMTRRESERLLEWCRSCCSTCGVPHDQRVHSAVESAREKEFGWARKIGRQTGAEVEAAAVELRRMKTPSSGSKRFGNTREQNEAAGATGAACQIHKVNKSNQFNKRWRQEPPEQKQEQKQEIV